MLSLRQKIYFSQKYHGEGPKLLAELDDAKEPDLPTPETPRYMRPIKLYGDRLKLFVANIKREMINVMP